ncbi:hypothetical protein ABEV74_15220 [Paenibacillus cisolokensis]|uniref:hypothetical protein n=1 Tax=Paenibacillus cisolokensis TaxID=1658519 RepID=UPI003D2D5EBC
MEDVMVVEKSNLTPGKSGVSKGLVAISAAAIILAIAAIVFAYVTYVKSVSTESSFAELEQSFEDLQKSYDSISEKFAEQDKVNKQYFNAQIFAALAHDMESGAVVTDNFKIESIIFWKTLTSMGTSGAKIDLGMQPSTALRYQGEGKFDYSDRELRVMTQSILDQAGTYYEMVRQEYMDYAPKWNEIEHEITVQNYPLGTYKDGKFKLVGEE